MDLGLDKLCCRKCVDRVRQVISVNNDRVLAYQIRREAEGVNLTSMDVGEWLTIEGVAEKHLGVLVTQILAPLEANSPLQRLSQPSMQIIELRLSGPLEPLDYYNQPESWSAGEATPTYNPRVRFECLDTGLRLVLSMQQASSPLLCLLPQGIPGLWQDIRPLAHRGYSHQWSVGRLNVSITLSEGIKPRNICQGHLLLRYVQVHGWQSHWNNGRLREY